MLCGTLDKEQLCLAGRGDEDVAMWPFWDEKRSSISWMPTKESFLKKQMALRFLLSYSNIDYLIEVTGQDKARWWLHSLSCI